MIKKICRECGSEMIRKQTTEGMDFFCEKCEVFSPFEEVDMEAYCPQCGEKVFIGSKCSSGFFCNDCNDLISGKKVVWRRK